MSRTLKSIIGLMLIAIVASAGVYPSVGLYYNLASDPVSSPGQAAPIGQLLIRTDSPSLYYKSGSSNTSWTQIGVSASSVGTITSVTAGNGLTGGGSTGAVTLNVGCSTGLSCGADTVTLNMNGASCSSGSFVSSISSTGTGTCSSSGISGTSNTMAKFTGSTTIGNSSVTDNGTTFAINSTQFTVTESNGNTLSNGTLTVNGNTSLGDTTSDTTTILGNVTASVLSASGSGTKAFNIRGGGGADSLTPASPEMVYLENAGNNVIFAMGSSTNRKVIAFGNTSNAEDGRIDYDAISRGMRFITANAVRGSFDSAGLFTVNNNAQVNGNTTSDTLTVTAASSLNGLSSLGNHQRVTGTALGNGDLSSCGGGTPTAAGTDVAGRITEGTIATGCVLTFKSSWTSAPFCVCSSETNAAGVPVTVSCVATATTLTFTNSSASGDIMIFRCTGQSNAT